MAPQPFDAYLTLLTYVPMKDDMLNRKRSIKNVPIIAQNNIGTQLRDETSFYRLAFSVVGSVVGSGLRGNVVISRASKKL